MKRYLLIILAICLAVSCGKEPEPIVPPVSEGRVTLAVTAESHLFTPDQDGTSADVHFKTKGGSVAMDVITNQDEWTYETENADWLEVVSDKYFLTLTADANASDSARTATIVIKAGDGDDEVSFTVEVSQNHPGTPEISLSQNSLHVKAHTSLVSEIEVETNQDEWDFDCTCSWLLIEKKEGALVLTADLNETTRQRIAEITVMAGDDTDMLQVSQDGTAFVVLSTQNVATDDDGDTKTVTVTSNPELDWDVVMDDCEWFSASREGNDVIVSINPNKGGNQRLGTFTVKVGDEDNNATAHVNVRQIGPDTEELIYEVLITEPYFQLTGAPVLTSSAGGNVTVDWGDGSPKETFDATRPVHVYEVPGRYTIEMTGNAKQLKFGIENEFSDELQSIISWGKMGCTTATDMCLGCIGLKSIPNDVAGSFASIKSFLGAFSCCTALEEIPAGLFRYATSAKNFEDCFSHTASISSIPEDLFANCPAAEDFSYTFYGTGSGIVETTNTLPNFSEVKEIVSSGKLTSIPAGLFSNCPSVKQMDHVFGATAITEVPSGIFSSQTNATVFTGAFSACVKLTDIATDFMSGASSATDIKYMFAGCESLKKIPAGMFVNNGTVTNLEYIFYKTGVESLPAGIFDGLSNVKTIGAVFQDCLSLSELSPEIFRGLTSAKSFKYCFSGCSSLRSIPADLFAGMTNAYEFKSTFEDTALESIPGSLFRDCRNYSSADFSYMLAGCMNLKTVPSELFEPFTAVTSPGFKNAFEYSGIETIPAGLFAKNSAVSSGFEEAFYGCADLKAIEGSIFAETTSVTSITRMFYGCSSLESLPEGLLSPLAGAKVKFTSTFENCSSLKTLPAGLFAGNTLSTSLVTTFRGCSALESIPADLIGNNEKLTDVRGLFTDCSSLKFIPEGLFAGTPAITSFESTFSGCSSLESLPEQMFAAIGTKTSSVKFSECFMDCSSLKSLPAGLFDTVTRINYIDMCFSGCISLSGESPYTIIGDRKYHLYDRERGDDFPNAPVSSSAHEACFAGCTGLADYNEIPSTWK